jgi:nuclear GTP-binding protein
MQTIKLDKLIKLFDSPGIVMSKDTDPASLVLRNCVRVSDTREHIVVVTRCRRRSKPSTIRYRPLNFYSIVAVKNKFVFTVDRARSLSSAVRVKMMLQYNLSDFQNVNEFLSKMSLKMGSLKKGGIPDINKAAQRVLTDWINGKLTYFTEPPERTGDIISTELVTQMKEAFDIDGLLENEVEQLQGLKNTPMTGIALKASTPMQAAMDFDVNVDDEINMTDDMDDTENRPVASQETKKVSRTRP